jgi:hydrogenase maturation protease
MNSSTPLLVLGLGNLLLEDDGVGPAVLAQLLEHFEPPDGVQVLDGGTLGLSLLPYVEDAASLILVDAIRADALPGSFVRLAGDAVAPAVATRLSVHQIGVSDLLEAARWCDRLPPRLVLLGLVPESMELGVGLSPRVRASVGDLTERIVEEAGAQGFEFRRRKRVDKCA